MTKKLFSILLAAALLLAMIPLAASAATMTSEELDAQVKAIQAEGSYLQTDARAMLDMINDFRTGPDAWYWNEDNTQKVQVTGLQELTYDYALEQIAIRRAAELSILFNHIRPDGTLCFDVVYQGINSWGENIACGSFTLTTEDAFTMWAEENYGYEGQGHRRNMLDEEFTSVGVACLYYKGNYYWVQEFGYENSGIEDTGMPTPHFTDEKGNDFFHDAVQWAVANGVTTGTTPLTFSPNEPCTRAQIVTFLWRSAGEPEPKTTTTRFTDVPAKEYYYKAVLWAMENGITTGTKDTTFSPNQACTRAQIVTFLWRYAGKPAPGTTKNPFKDVPAGEYYTDAVLWAVENGITTGMEPDTFSPEGKCTRGQGVTFLYRDLA